MKFKVKTTNYVSVLPPIVVPDDTVAAVAATTAVSVVVAITAVAAATSCLHTIDTRKLGEFEFGR